MSNCGNTHDELNYRKLKVYQKSREYVVYIYRLIKRFPDDEKFALCNQLRRAAVSITSNIAEGMGRYSDKEKLHFLEISFGSLYETMSQIEVAFDLQYLVIDDFNEVEKRVVEIARMLSGLRNYILNGSQKISSQPSQGQSL